MGENMKGGKMYIQYKVEEYADDIFTRLDGGAHIYFCGLKGMMPGIQGMLEVVCKGKGLDYTEWFKGSRRTASGTWRCTKQAPHRCSDSGRKIASVVHLFMLGLETVRRFLSAAPDVNRGALWEGPNSGASSAISLVARCRDIARGARPYEERPKCAREAKEAIKRPRSQEGIGKFIF